MIVCLDTMVLVWGIQRKALDKYSHKVGHTAALLRRLESDRATVIVPAPVVFELLLRTHTERHGEVLKELNQRFRIFPYDLQAAALNAEIWLKRNGGPKPHREIRYEWPQATKAELRFDCQIVAIAARNGASVLFSEDSDIQSFADGVVRVSPVPETTEQLTFFE